MPNLLQRGADWLGGKLQRSAGRTVTVNQGTTRIDSLNAPAAMHEHEVMDDEGFPEKLLFYDWIFTASDLETAAPGFAFRAGAIVSETILGVVHKYEATPIGKRPCCERLDSSGVLLMLHTKKVS